jgi:hypothetical protein
MRDALSREEGRIVPTKLAPFNKSPRGDFFTGDVFLATSCLIRWRKRR